MPYGIDRRNPARGERIPRAGEGVGPGSDLWAWCQGGATGAWPVVTHRATAALWAVALAAVLAVGPAAAQTPPTQLPGAAEPGRVVPPEPVLPPPIDLQWSIELPPGIEPPKALRGVSMTLKDIVLDGVTVYRREDLLDLFGNFLGKEITFGEFYDIARAIQARYRRDGYILTFTYIPPQTVETGVFRITVVEGFIDQIVVEDVEGRLKSTLEAILAPLARMRPLKSDHLERYLLLANDLAGIKVTGVLQPSKAARGATDLIAKVVHKTFDGGAGIDNRASEFTGRWQANVDFAVNSALGTGERFSMTLLEANGFNELVSVTARYSQPVGAEGLRLDTVVSYSDAEPGFTLDSFEVETQNLNIDFDASFPVIRTRAETLTLSAGLTYRNTKVDLLQAPFTRDRIRLVRGRVSYNRVGFIGGSSAVTLGVAQALPVLNHTDPDSEATDTSRADSQPHFTKATLDIVHLQPLPASFGLRLAVSSQYARAPLPASEEFSVGGARFGRAYNAGEVTGEDGIAVSAELEYVINPGIALIRRIRPYGYFDFGKVWDESSSSSEGLAQSLASAGVGVRLALIQGATVRLEYARPLTRGPSNQTGDKQDRFTFFAGWRF